MKTTRQPQYPAGHGGYFHSIVTVVDDEPGDYAVSFSVWNSSGELLHNSPSTPFTISARSPDLREAKKSLMVDTFTYLPNGSPILYLRLKELYEVVDYFVILVGSHTHTGRPIPTTLFPGGFFGMSPEDPTRNWWGMGDKVIVVTVDVGEAREGDEGSLQRESSQRDATLGAVREIAYREKVEHGNVYVIVSDADEITRRSNLNSIRSHLATSDSNIMLMLQWHVYNFNYLISEPKDNYASLEWGVIAREAAYATTLERMEGKSCTDERRGLRHVDYDDLKPLPSIIPHAGWHLASFGGANEVINKIKNTCCSPSQFEGETFEDLKAMESLMQNGIPYYQAQGWGETTSEISPVWLHDAFGFGIGVPSAAQGCKLGEGEYCRILFPEKVEPTFKQNYDLNQRLLKLNKDSGTVSVDHFTTHNALKSEDVDELKCSCGEEVAEVERYSKILLTKIGTELDDNTKADLVQRLVNGCSNGVTSTLVRHDNTHYLDVEFDGVVYVVALKRTDNAAEIASFHCEGMGMDSQSCDGLTTYLLNVW
ncbi:hypothetical protein TrVE_jg13075 [Triparma verrucosa]|nr:hypothetical protein TrVE_jg13075 [Triparma verrucosa]